MTANDDIDRISRAWLDLMPDEAPDRAVRAVLQAVETTPQVRRPWRWLPWRSTPMNRALLAIGATAVIVAAGALYFGRSSSSPSVGVSPTPAVSATPSGVSTLLPTELRSRWFGGHRDFVQLDKGSTLSFTGNRFEMNQSNQWDLVSFLNSSASAIGNGQLRLELTADGDGCAAGDVGEYSCCLLYTSDAADE